MSTKRYADSESDPEFADDPTAVHDQPTAQWKPPGLDGDTEPMVAPPPSLDGPSSAQGGLLTAAASDRCTNCGSQLTPDQRYCVVCGERRGRARFANAMFSPQTVAAPEPELAMAGFGSARTTRYPPAATWIAAIAVLLIAVGLGILIGHDSSGKTLAPQPKVNVTVNGGGGSGAASNSGTTASTTASSNKTSSTSSKATKTATTAAKAPSTAQQAKSQAAASHVLGASTKNVPAPTVQQGGACTHGAGCQNGHFTGNFFGG